MKWTCVRIANTAVLIWLVLAAFTNGVTQDSNSRYPNVSDWRTFHRQNDEYWARFLTATTGWNAFHSKIEITGAEVRAIRLSAGIRDNEPSDPILQFAGGSMREGQFLLVTATANACMNVAVYDEGGLRRPKRLWSIDALPDGNKICQPSGCARPRVMVNEKHEIAVATAFRSTTNQPVCDGISSATYRPKGKVFEVEHQHTGTAACWFDSFSFGLNSAFKQAAGPGETLAIVQVLPALTLDKYALVLHRRATGLAILRMELNDDDWSAPLLSKTKPTASECFAHAKSLPVRVKSLGVPEDQAEALENSLQSLDLGLDHCARGVDGQCAFLLDGRAFYLQVGERAPIRLTDVQGITGYTSENPAVSAWVYDLLEQAKHAEQIATK